jgi:hypothetical protein
MKEKSRGRFASMERQRKSLLVGSYILEAGLFKDVDVLLGWHPQDVTTASFQYSKAVASVQESVAGGRREERFRRAQKRPQLPPADGAQSQAANVAESQ